MRPVTLTMQAFGPYRGIQILDFNELGHNRLFLIHGTTGAGKTTILDAICYALYGDTSGGERSGTQMRCESADPALLTRVTFDFALGNSFYRVLREPQQEKAAKQSNKTLVNHPTSATLWEIDQFGAEVKVLESGSSKVGGEIESLLGFSSAQFRQVVVLPQGKFRDLLTAKSDERAKILSQLFGTDKLAAIERVLLERSSSVTKRREDLLNHLCSILSTVDVESVEVLEAQTREAAASVAATKAATRQAEKSTRAASAAFDFARSRAETLRHLEAARLELSELQAKEPEIAELKGRVGQCYESRKVQPLSEKAEIAAAELEEMNQVLAAAQAHLADARVAEAAAVEELAAEERRGAEREQAQGEVRRIAAMQTKLAEWQGAVSRKTSAREQLAAAEANVQSARDAVTAARKAQEQAKADGDEAQDAIGKLERLKSLLEQDVLSHDRLKRLVTARTGLAAAQESLDAAQLAVASASHVLESVQARHVRIEQEWRAGRAASLAQTLAAGEPCPVCGSMDHPAPAAAASEADDATLEHARSAVDQARTELDSVTAAASRAESAKATAAAQVSTLEQEAGTTAALDEVSERIADHKAAIVALQAIVTTVGDPRESAANAKESLAAAEFALTKATESETTARAEFTVASTTAEVHGNALPEELRSESALDTALGTATTNRDALDSALAQAKAFKQSAKEACIAVQRDLIAATDSRAKVGKKSEAADKALVAALKAHGFADATSCEAALLIPAELENLESEIAAHGDSVTRANAQIVLAQTLMVTTPVTIDIDLLESEAQAANDAYTRAVQAQTQADDRVSSLNAVRERIDQVDADIKALDDEWKVLGVLAAVANGNGTGARITFERWVLGTYLDEVLHAASKRLLRMSQGRYRLKRQREGTDGRRVSGLDLAVLDNWHVTERSAKTLSGGESFLAALSLALGLAESVQEQAGGTRLETVFVDEGFGSLDQEALESAMTALMELKDSGRLVGVISHVPGMLERIDAQLVVSGDSGGSTAKFVVA